MSENVHDSKLVIIEVLRSITGIKYYVFHDNSQFVIIFFWMKIPKCTWNDVEHEYASLTSNICKKIEKFNEFDAETDTWINRSEVLHARNDRVIFFWLVDHKISAINLCLSTTNDENALIKSINSLLTFTNHNASERSKKKQSFPVTIPKKTKTSIKSHSAYPSRCTSTWEIRW